MILAARKVIDKYGETFEILAAAEELKMMNDDFSDPTHAEAIRLCEQMLDRDRPVIAAALKGVITGDVFRGVDGSWWTKGVGPDSRELSRLLPKIEKEMDDLERWWSNFRQGRQEG